MTISEKEQEEKEFEDFLNSPKIRKLMKKASYLIRVKLDTKLFNEFARISPERSS